jgi:hypothetical protein
MPHSKREMLMVGQRRAEVAALYLKGLPQHEIVRRLGLVGNAGAAVVSRDLKAVREGWKQSALRDFDAARGRLVEEVALARAEAWAAWEKSKQAKPNGKGKAQRPEDGDAASGWQMLRETAQSDLEGLAAGAAKPPEGAKPPAAEKPAETCPGDPRFLDLVLRYIAEEAELLGLKAKAGDQGGAVPVVGFRVYRQAADGQGPGEVIEAVAAAVPAQHPGQPPPLPPGLDPSEWEWEPDGVETQGEKGDGR